MKVKGSIFLIVVLLLIFTAIAIAAFATGVAPNWEKCGESGLMVFGPKNYAVSNGKPCIFTDSFEAPVVHGIYVLRLYNGDIARKKKISDISLKINEQKINIPHNLMGKHSYIEIPIKVQKENRILVKLEGKPGSFITLEVICKANLWVVSPCFKKVVWERTVDIIGKTHVYGENIRVQLEGYGETKLDKHGNFRFNGYILNDGENIIRVKLLYDSQCLGGARTVIHCIIPGEASGEVTPDRTCHIEVNNFSSPLYRAAMDFPLGAVERPIRARIEYYEENDANLECGDIAVGPVITFAPIGEEFLKPITLTIPFDSGLLPKGTSATDVSVKVMSDQGLIELPVISRTAHAVQIAVTNLAYDKFVAVVSQPLLTGEVRVHSNPANASLYIDGFHVETTTPVTLSGISPGEHTLKLYLPGFNEVFSKIVVPQDKGLEVRIALGVPGLTPAVILDESITNGMIMYDNLFRVFGKVTQNNTSLLNGVAVISLNNEDSLTNINNGEFSDYVSLLPGENVLEVRVNGSDGSTGISRKVTIFNNEGTTPFSLYRSQVIYEASPKNQQRIREKLLAAPDSGVAASETRNIQIQSNANQDQAVTIVLTWDTEDTDVDLHVFDPNQNHAWYGNLGGIPGGALDHDDVDGYGPEIFSMPAPANGTYHVRVDYYSDHDKGPTTATLKVYIGNNLKFSQSYYFSACDSNATNGTGNSSASFWNAYSFTIGDFRITSVKTQTQSPLTEAIFTTHSDENLITVIVSAPDDITDDQIFYEIKETVENHTIDTTQLNGRSIQFRAQHKPLQGLINPRNSHPLTYEIVAYTMKDGQLDKKTPPVKIVQSVKSRIRQEYIDKANLRSGFRLNPPAYGTIIDASGYNTSVTPNFTFNEFAGYSDFAPRYAVINQSASIAQSVRNAWGLVLRVTSGWRNPRRNDSISGSALNSFHQTGDAVDLNPTYSKSGWPEGINTYYKAQRKLETIARKTLGSGYYVLYHLNHVHIEVD